MSKLYSIGELLVDFQSVGVASLKKTDQFCKKAGGAPANVCVQAQKLGQETVYLTQVGSDDFGRFLVDTLIEQGIDCSHVLISDDYDTSLAFVSFTEEGEREFNFFRRMAADLYFKPKDFKDVEFTPGDMLEFGSVALQTKIAQKTHKFLIKKAKKQGAIICFDPNLRLNLWTDKEALRSVVKEYAPYADVIKIGLDEVEFITEKTGEDAIKEFMYPNVKLLCVTDGGKGARLYTKDGETFSHSGYKVKTVDTTGAGDSFFGAMLAQLLENKVTLETLGRKGSLDYQKVLDFSCKCGAYTTTNYGAISAMGTKEEIERSIK